MPYQQIVKTGGSWWQTPILRRGFWLFLLAALISLTVQPVAHAQPSLPAMNLVGNAALCDTGLCLTPNAPQMTGAAWLVEKQQVAGGFEAQFQWQITRGNPRRGADGFALVLHNDSNDPFPHLRLGAVRHGLGYAGIRNSLAIEFDTVKNPPTDFGGGLGDYNDNHVSVQTRGTEPNNANTDFSLGYTTQLPPGIPLFADGGVHTTKVVYQPGTLTIFLDDMTTPVLTVPVDLGTTLRLDNGTAWVGFTATTGRRSQAHDILSFSFAGTEQATPTPTPTPTPEPGATRFSAQLDGRQEVPQRETQATGNATFEVTAQNQIAFTLAVADIQNLTAAHIHCAPAGENGDVGVTLFGPVGAGGGAVDAFSTTGTITQPNLNNGCDWADMAAVIAAMQEGSAYVNVHTDDGENPADTGAGDFPDGEIRGQVQETGS